MATLLLRLAGPLQSWGSISKLDTRTTGSEPTKSGVIGMISSAMGRSRKDPVSDLAALRFGVRTDQVGNVIRDFHTAHGKKDYLTNRYYLEDAIFIIGLEGEKETLVNIMDALRHPFHPLSLGRRSCAPTGRMIIGLTDESLLPALKNTSWTASEWYMCKQSKTVPLELTYDAADGSKGVLVKDVPVSFLERDRRYAYRDVVRDVNGVMVDNPLGRDIHSGHATTHDPFPTIRGD